MKDAVRTTRCAHIWEQEQAKVTGLWSRLHAGCRITKGNTESGDAGCGYKKTYGLQNRSLLGHQNNTLDVQ